jgi:hypothetical protein
MWIRLYLMYSFYECSGSNLTQKGSKIKFCIVVVYYLMQKKKKDLRCLVNSEKKSIPDVIWIIDKKAKMRNILYLPDNDHFVYEIEFVQHKQK